MSGLLERGIAYVNKLREMSGESLENFQLTGTEGISKEDQTEILTEIEKVAAENRISVTPQLFVYKPAKRGSSFPVIVNMAAVVSLVAGLGLMAYFFRQSESRITRHESTITTAEGEILQEVKRESAQQLQQKDQEIASIQSKLKDIDAQRASLQNNMDAQIQQRETELRKQMQDALDAERATLRSQGVSDADITARLQTLEQQKTAEFNKQLDDFRKQAEAERTRLSGSLQTLQQQYQTDLAKATADRQQIAEAAQQRETQLRAQFEGKLSQSQQQLSSTQSQLSAAQQQLQQLQSSAQQETAAAAQITGFYTTVRQQVTSGDYQGAKKTLSSLRDFLSSDSIMAIDAIRQRRPAELFIINSLNDLIDRQTAQASQDAQSLVAAASLVNEARTLTDQAQQQLSQGNTTDAEANYRKVIALIPGIAAANQYFSDRQNAALTDAKKQLADLGAQRDNLAATNANLQKQLQSEASANQSTVGRLQTDAATRQATVQKLTAALAQAKVAYGSKNYQQSLDAYKTALSLIPDVPGLDAATILTQIGAATVSLQNTTTVNAASAAAAPLVTRAQSLYRQGDYAGAIQQYSDVLRNYPLASQAPDAVQGIRDAFNAHATALQAKIDQLTQERDSLNNQIAALKGGTSPTGTSSAGTGSGGQSTTGGSSADQTLSQENQRLATLNQQLSSQVATLQQQMKDIDAQRSDLQTRLTQAQSDLAAAAKQDAQNRAEITRLTAFENQYKTLESSYKAYGTGEDKIMSGPQPTQQQLIQGKLLLDNFLGSNQMRATFPGLLDRIKRYDQGFEASGRSSAISDLSDVVYGLSQISTTGGRADYLTQQIDQTSDATEKSFLEDLKSLVAAQ